MAQKLNFRKTALKKLAPGIKPAKESCVVNKPGATKQDPIKKGQ